MGTLTAWNFGSTDTRWSEIADFEQIIARSASAVTPSGKSSINTNRKSTTRFPMSLRWSSYVAPKSPQGGGGSKTQNGRFPSKITLHLKEICYKVSSHENCQRKSCKAFIGLPIRAKMIGGGVPFYLKYFGSNWPRCSEIADFLYIFTRSASAVTPSEKTSMNTNRKSTTRFQWTRDKHCTLSLSPQSVDQKRKVSRMWTISCDISETVRDGI